MNKRYNALCAGLLLACASAVFGMETEQNGVMKLDLAEHGDALLDAAWGGNLLMVRMLCNRAAHFGPEATFALLAQRSHLDNARGMTALHCAAVNGHTAVVDELLGCGASVDATDATRRTPLEVAIVEGHTPVVRRLLQANAGLEPVFKSGEPHDDWPLEMIDTPKLTKIQRQNMEALLCREQVRRAEQIRAVQAQVEQRLREQEDAAFRAQKPSFLQDRVWFDHIQEPTMDPVEHGGWHGLLDDNMPIPPVARPVSPTDSLPTDPGDGCQVDIYNALGYAGHEMSEDGFLLDDCGSVLAGGTLLDAWRSDQCDEQREQARGFGQERPVDFVQGDSLEDFLARCEAEKARQCDCLARRDAYRGW